METSPKTRRTGKQATITVQVKDAERRGVTASITLSQPGDGSGFERPDLPQRPPHDLLQLLQRQ